MDGAGLDGSGQFGISSLPAQIETDRRDHQHRAIKPARGHGRVRLLGQRLVATANGEKTWQRVCAKVERLHKRIFAGDGSDRQIETLSLFPAHHAADTIVPDRVNLGALSRLSSRPHRYCGARGAFYHQSRHRDPQRAGQSGQLSTLLHGRPGDLRRQSRNGGGVLHDRFYSPLASLSADRLYRALDDRVANKRSPFRPLLIAAQDLG